MLRFLRKALRRFRRTKYLITDRGGEFIATVFRKAARRLGIFQRFASKENLYATARLERTLKENAWLYRLCLPLTLADLECRLAFALTHYVWLRPTKDSAAQPRVRRSSDCHRPVETRSNRHADGRVKQEPTRRSVAFLDPDGHHFRS